MLKILSASETLLQKLLSGILTLSMVQITICISSATRLAIVCRKVPNPLMHVLLPVVRRRSKLKSLDY